MSPWQQLPPIQPWQQQLQVQFSYEEIQYPKYTTPGHQQAPQPQQQESVALMEANHCSCLQAALAPLLTLQAPQVTHPLPQQQLVLLL
jgi:hypothetical protein